MNSYSIAAGVIKACWGIFALYWLASSLFTKRTSFRQRGGVRGNYWILAIFAWILLTQARRFPDPLAMPLVPRMDWVAWMAAALGVCGLGICLWARITLGQNWSGTVTLKENHVLVQQGPYRFVRHPIYTGILTMFLGSALLLGHAGGLIAVLLLLGSFWIKLRLEEMLMLRQFPNDYPAYMQRVKRLIPFIL